MSHKTHPQEEELDRHIKKHEDRLRAARVEHEDGLRAARGDSTRRGHRSTSRDRSPDRDHYTPSSSRHSESSVEPSDKELNVSELLLELKTLIN